MGAVKSPVGPSPKEGAAAAVALARPAPQGSSGWCSPHSVLTRECPAAEAGRGGGAGSTIRGNDFHLLTVLPPPRPRRNSSSSSSPSERPRQKLSRKAASSANLLLRSGSTERWARLPSPPPAPPQAQVLDFSHPSPHFPGWGGGTSLHNRKKGTSTPGVPAVYPALR